MKNRNGVSKPLKNLFLTLRHVLLTPFLFWSILSYASASFPVPQLLLAVSASCLCPCEWEWKVRCCNTLFRYDESVQFVLYDASHLRNKQGLDEPTTSQNTAYLTLVLLFLRWGLMHTIGFQRQETSTADGFPTFFNLSSSLGSTPDMHPIKVASTGHKSLDKALPPNSSNSSRLSAKITILLA